MLPSLPVLAMCGIRLVASLADLKNILLPPEGSLPVAMIDEHVDRRPIRSRVCRPTCLKCEKYLWLPVVSPWCSANFQFPRSGRTFKVGSRTLLRMGNTDCPL